MSEVMELIARNDELENLVEKLRTDLRNEMALVKHLQDELKSKDALLQSKTKDEPDNKNPIVFANQILDVVWDNNRELDGFISDLRRLIAHMTVELMVYEKEMTD